jgi:hypothetical protein
MTGGTRIVIGNFECHNALWLVYMPGLFVRDRQSFELNIPLQITREPYC